MVSSMLRIRDWKTLPARQALGPQDIAAALSGLAGWALVQTPQPAIEKTFTFGNYFETLAFVNALALIAHREDHHPELLVRYDRCVVRFGTHDAGGVSATDLVCARQADALLAAAGEPG